MARFISWNILTVLCMLSAAECNKKPNIIIIMADDLVFIAISKFKCYDNNYLTNLGF